MVDDFARLSPGKVIKRSLIRRGRGATGAADRDVRR
jgi:hypothetical protein